MEIKYTYKEPDDRPIEKAEFKSSGHGECLIKIGDNIEIVFTGVYGVDIKRAFTKADFADFAALVNRINRQINGVSS